VRLGESLDRPIDMHCVGFAVVSGAFEGRCVMFANRVEAGRRLAERIRGLGVNGFTTVLGLPRGGVPVAAEVARLLDVPFDVLVVRKLGHPANPELAMGAVAEDGARVINQDLAGDSEELLACVHAASLEVRKRVRRFRGGRALPPLNGRTAILVDDGLATGASMQAAVSAVRQKHPARIVVAIPVGPPEVLRSITAVADEVICLQSPEIFSSVGEFYDDFGEVTDEDVERLLKQHSRGVHGNVVLGDVRSVE
jgi:putative phosphoribosyl transferase